MDKQSSNQSSLSDNKPSDYQSYADGVSNISSHGPQSSREFERDLILTEYEGDRDAILMAIKAALKNKEYDEAQEFVYKYRAAAQTDEEFALLGKLVAQKLDDRRKIDKILAVLDATEDNNYKGRKALCEKILKIDPGHERAKNDLELCRRALNIPSPELAGENAKSWLSSPDGVRLLSILTAILFVVMEGYLFIRIFVLFSILPILAIIIHIITFGIAGPKTLAQFKPRLIINLAVLCVAYFFSLILI